jgi:hypothetical protein
MRPDPEMAHPRPGFIEIGRQRLDDPMTCPRCGEHLTELRVMERSGPKETVWLYDCPIYGDNVWGGRGHSDSPPPPLG